jgi:hypothetical protein
MENFTIIYYNNYSRFTESFTPEQAKAELKAYGWPNVEKLTNSQLFAALQEIYLN